MQNARSQEEALRIVADRMATYETAAQRAGVASALFSRAGVDMVRILGQGSRVFDETARKAEEMGLIFEEDLLNRAEEIQNEYGLATQVIDTQFKSALVELAPVLTAMANSLGSTAKETRELASDIAELTSEYSGAFVEAKKFWQFMESLPFNPLNPLGSVVKQGRLALQQLSANRQAIEHADEFAGITVPSAVPVPRNRPAGLVPQSPSRGPSELRGIVPRIKPLRQEASGLASDLKLLNDGFDLTIEKTDTWTDTLQSGLSGIGSGLVGVARGTRSLNDLLDSTIDRMASLAADNLFNSLLGGLFGSFGGGPTNIVPSGFAGFFATGGQHSCGAVRHCRRGRRAGIDQRPGDCHAHGSTYGAFGRRDYPRADRRARGAGRCR